MDTIFALTWILCPLMLIYIIIYKWKRRFLYYHASKFPGPTSLPIIGNWELLTARKDFIKRLLKTCGSQPPVFKVWIGPTLCILVSDPEYIPTLLNAYLEKVTSEKRIMRTVLNNPLLTAPASIWKGRRKLINHCFHQKTVDSFHDSFVKYSKQLVDLLEKKCDQELTDLMSDVWKCILDNIIETIVGLDPGYRINLYELIRLIARFRKSVTKRFDKLQIDFVPFWHSRTEVEYISKSLRDIGKEVIVLKKGQMGAENRGYEPSKKNLLQSLINLSLRGERYSEEEIVDESVFMYMAASETTSATVTYVLLVLAVFPEIQEKIYQETLSVTTKDPTLGKTNQLEFLERVIKETMRLFPITPLLARTTDRDIQLGSHVFPAGSCLFVPVVHIHRRPDLWPDPLKFDPDRFLPEEVAKRHRCAYLPFGFGPRNCLGSKYAMMSMKVMVAYVVKNFIIEALNYRQMEDIQQKFQFVMKPVGNHLRLSKRKN